MEMLRRFAVEEESVAEPPSRPKVPSGQPLEEPLTDRELEILQYVMQGFTNHEIAQRLVISTGTVKHHVRHIIAKLGVSDRTQAAVRAIELGLLG